MGWALNNCSVRNQKPSNYLIIELSPSNTSGCQKINSFGKYLYQKNANINVSISQNKNKKDLITMKYYTSGKQEIIYEGNDLGENVFDSLYNKIISI